jgi:hypothetical protein
VTADREPVVAGESDPGGTAGRDRDPLGARPAGTPTDHDDYVPGFGLLVVEVDPTLAGLLREAGPTGRRRSERHLGN